jgi:hypothetical protein
MLEADAYQAAMAVRIPTYLVPGLERRSLVAVRWQL